MRDQPLRADNEGVMTTKKNKKCSRLHSSRYFNSKA